jgi:hypothetical protein
LAERYQYFSTGSWLLTCSCSAGFRFQKTVEIRRNECHWRTAMTEPDVALTDYAVALECIFLIFFFPGGVNAVGLRFWFTVFLGSICAASVCGGTVRGFFLDERTLGYAILWPATLLAMGVTALAIWAIAANLLFPRWVVRWVLVMGGIQYFLSNIAVLVLIQEFWVAMVNNLPAILFLMFALGVTYHREKHWRLLLAAAGPALVLIAAVFQYLHVGVDPVYFDYNSLYHVLQGVGFSCSSKVFGGCSAQSGCRR